MIHWYTALAIALVAAGLGIVLGCTIRDLQAGLDFPENGE